MTEKLDPRPDIKPGPQGGDVDLIAFLRSMGVDESEKERKAVEAYNRFLKVRGGMRIWK
jgi:hypothetical protein